MGSIPWEPIKHNVNNYSLMYLFDYLKSWIRLRNVHRGQHKTMFFYQFFNCLLSLAEIMGSYFLLNIFFIFLSLAILLLKILLVNGIFFEDNLLVFTPGIKSHEIEK